MIVYCYPRCSTCKKAEEYLKKNKIDYEYRDITKETPSAKELEGYINKSGLPLKRFFNTSGKLYREMELKDRVEGMSVKEAAKLLATDGMLIKRPLVIEGDTVLTGFREAEWSKL